MPPPFFPNVRAFVQAEALRTELALAVVKLFQSGFVPTVETVVGDLDTNEATYSDYVPETITAWGIAISSSAGGAQITAPTVQFECVGAQAVPNTIGGYWIETAAGAVVLIRQFDAPVPMVNDHDGLTITPTIIVPNGV